MRALALSFALLVGCGASAPKPAAPTGDEKEEHEQKIALDAVPPDVMQAVLARYPDAKLHKAEKVTNADQSIVYELGFETGAGWKEATFKPDGTFVEEE